MLNKDHVVVVCYT